MTLNQFIQTTNLKAADAIVVKKPPFGLLDHYIIYLGFHYGEHKFIANYSKGTRILEQHELIEFAKDFVPNRIRKFIGNDIQRNAAVNRALSRVDENSYHLLLNNCEHYANYVQSNTPFSKQTTVAGTGMVVAGLATAAASKDSTIRGIGLFAAALGLITLLLDEE